MKTGLTVVWEHDDVHTAADAIARLVRTRRPDKPCKHRDHISWSHGESNPDLSLAKAPFYR